MARRREKYVEQWFAGVVVLAIILYTIFTVLLWLLIVGLSLGLLVGAYYLTDRVFYIAERIWLVVLIWIFSILIVLFWGSEVLADYGKIDKSLREVSIETAQNFKLLKSNRWNYKVTPDYESMVQSATPDSNTGATAIVNDISSNIVTQVFDGVVNTIRDRFIDIFKR